MVGLKVHGNLKKKKGRVNSFLSMMKCISLMAENSSSKAVLEPGQLPQETICPSVAFTKGLISAPSSLFQKVAFWRSFIAKWSP